MRSRIGLPQVGFGVALLVGLTASAFSWPAYERPSLQLQAWMTGQFVLDEPPGTIERRLGQAFRHAGSNLSSVARSQLSQVLHYCRAYDLALTENEVRIRCDENPPLKGSLPGLLPPTALAQMAPVHVEVSEDTVEVVPERGGGRRTTYRFDDAGRLEVRVEVSSDQLARSLDWTVRYRRVTPLSTPPTAVSVAER